MLFPSHFLYVFIKRLLSEILNLLLKKCRNAQAKAEKAAQTQTAFGGFLAGKTALGASSAEKSLNKKYKFDGEAMSVAEFVERHANDDTLALSTSEVNKYKGASRSAWNRMSEAEQKADEERVKNSGTKTVYMVNGYDLGKTAYEYAQHLIKKGERRKQEGEKSLAGVVDGKIYKNNLAGGNAVAVVRGKSDGKVLVAYASDVEDAQNGLFMGEEVVSDSDMAQMLERGEFAELKQETAGQSVNERIAQAEGETNVAPSDGQKEAGNYKKGHVRVAGYDISIEQPKGSVRSGVDANGNKWEQTMRNTYGYFRGTEGVDGDHIDVFLANDLDAWNGEQVFVVDQYNEDGSFDEHKVMLGFDSIEDAQSAYLSNYEDGWADKHRIVVMGTNAADFKKWVDSSHRKTKAFADYKNVKKNEGQSGTDNSGSDGVAADRTKESGASLRSNLADFKEGDVVRDYYDQQLYRIKKHSKNGVSTIAMLDEDGNEVGTKQMNAHNNSRYSLAEPSVKTEAPTISQESEQAGGSDGVAANGTKGSTRAKNDRKSNPVGKQEKSKKSGRGSRMLGDYYDQEFEDGLANGHDVVRKEPKTKGTIFDFVTKDKTRPAMQGIHHDGGYAIATDGYVMVGRKDKYDAALDGKTINKKGEPITYEENGEVKDVPYPNWKIAVPQTTEPTGIDIDDLASVIEGIRIADGVKQDSQLIYPISIKTADGKIVSMPQGHLRRFLRGAKQVGATEVSLFVSERGSAILKAEGSKGFAIVIGSTGVLGTANSFYDAYTKDASSTAGTADYNIADEDLMAERGSEAFARATEHTIDALKVAGVEVVEATDAMVEEMLGLAEMHKQKKAPETASVQEEHQPTVVSSADGAKLLKDLDSAITEYENKSGQSKTFLGDIAQVLGATKHGSNSQYATFEAVNGKVFTIRLANHNAKVSNFDNHGENEGISIVVTAQDNNGINNDGNAHVVEFFYDAIKLRKADGKPLVEILKSIKQALYSGEYKDTTGLAQAEEVNIEFLRTADGVVYGWAVGGKVYLTKEGMNPNTPAHEYTHLWAQMVEKADPKLWGRIVDGLRGCATWNDVLNDKAYEGIWSDDSRMASEVLSRLTGAENYRREMARAQTEIADAKGVFDKAEKVSVWENVKKALRWFLDKVKSLIQKGETIRNVESDVPAWMEFVDMALGDLYGGVNPGNRGGSAELMFSGEKGAAAMDKAEEASVRLDNLAVARDMEAQGKEALAIKMATGWERGADGKWRYETEDVKLKKDFWKKKDVTLGDVADLGELAKAYPDLKDIKVVLDTNESEKRGAYNHKKNTITLYIMDANNTRKIAGAISRNIPFTKFIADYMTSSAKKSVDKTLIHEIQHAIQHREGFAKGGNMRMRFGESEERLGYDGYRKLAGEVEARNVSERMGKSIDERRASLRTETQDVADEDQIFIYEGLKSAMSDQVALNAPISPIEMSAEEKAQRGEMLRTAPAIDVPSNVITHTGEVSARKAAEMWWDNNVKDSQLYSTEIGEVEINKNSVESSLAHRYSQKKLDAITSLVDGFNNAVYLGTLPDGNRQEGVQNHYFAYPINYDGERNYVFCRAMQDANKNRLYVHEVFVADKIKEGDTLQTAASQPHGGISLYRDILANVLSVSKVTENSVAEQNNGLKNIGAMDAATASQRTGQDDDALYRTSDEIDAQYPNWLDGTTTESGKHSTQVEGTRKTYNKVGTWIEEHLGKDVEILDASSGMGYGTADLRERGFNIEDVEPYQSAERKANNPATYSSYADIAVMPY